MSEQTQPLLPESEYLAKLYSEGKTLWFNSDKPNCIKANCIGGALNTLARVSKCSKDVDFRNMPYQSVESFKSLLSQRSSYAFSGDIAASLQQLEFMLT